LLPPKDERTLSGIVLEYYDYLLDYLLDYLVDYLVDYLEVVPLEDGK
jgi:hypothetical protein